MTYCFGLCNVEYLTPATFNISTATRQDLINYLLQDVDNPIPGPSCVPDKIENDEIIISDSDGDVVEMYSFPQVATCKCSV